MLEPFTLTETATDTHDPTPAVRELIDLRDLGCLGIGCSMSAARSEHDHEDPWPTGPTASWNLSNKSPRCHHAKHAGWTATRDDTTGNTTWRSPLGHTYTRLSAWQPQPPTPEDPQLPPPDLHPPSPDQDNTLQDDSPLALPEPMATQDAETQDSTEDWMSWPDGDDPPF